MRKRRIVVALATGSVVAAGLVGAVGSAQAVVSPDASDSRGAGAAEAIVEKVGAWESWSKSARAGGETVVKHEGATYVKVSFSNLRLAPGDSLTVSDPEGRESYTYKSNPRTTKQGNAGFTVHNGSGAKGFAAMSVEGDTAVVTLKSSGSGSAYTINGFWRGYDAKEFKDANPRSICGADARRDAVCYEQSRPEEYGKGQAVARVLMEGGSACTAWRVGNSNAVMTNNHCMASAGEVQASETQFDYQCATCDGDDPKEPVKVSGADMAKTNADLDYTLYSVNDFDSISSFGTLYLETREPSNGERIYIPGHGDAAPKRISIFEESDDGEECTIKEPQSDDVNAGYSCDTSGGNSGSPVIAGDSGKVIALHHLGGCPGALNYGARISLIYPEIADLIDNG